MSRDSGDMILLQNDRDALQRGFLVEDPKGVLLQHVSCFTADNHGISSPSSLTSIACGENLRAPSFPSM
jgi:hypothetical protein